MNQFKELCYKSLDDFIYGKSLYPVKAKSGLEIGGGLKRIDECSTIEKFDPKKYDL